LCTQDSPSGRVTVCRSNRRKGAKYVRIIGGVAPVHVASSHRRWRELVRACNIEPVILDDVTLTISCSWGVTCLQVPLRQNDCFGYPFGGPEVAVDGPSRPAALRLSFSWVGVHITEAPILTTVSCLPVLDSLPFVYDS
jgi:hypothetical protein